jgi:hypothetical protein
LTKKETDQKNAFSCSPPSSDILLFANKLIRKNQFHKIMRRNFPLFPSSGSLDFVYVSYSALLLFSSEKKRFSLNKIMFHFNQHFLG